MWQKDNVGIPFAHSKSGLTRTQLTITKMVINGDNSMFSKNHSTSLIAIALLWALITNIMALSVCSEDVSIWDYVDEGRIFKVGELICDADYLLDTELNAIKNHSIGELHLPYFVESDKMKDNSLCHLDSLDFGGDDEVKDRFVKKLTDYRKEPNPGFFEDKMVLPYWTLDFKVTAPSYFAANTLSDLFEAYDSRVSYMLYLVFDAEDCFVFELNGDGGRPYMLQPWNAQSFHPDFARYRTLIWSYKEIQNQLNSKITRIMYSEVGLNDVIILYMTDNGAMAQLINGDKYVLLSENEFQEIFSEYEANRNLEPGVQYGVGNGGKTAGERTKKIWITFGAISAAIVMCATIVFVLLYKKHIKKTL